VKKTNINPLKRERGSAVLEMAVILPLATILLSAILTLGPYVHIGIAVRQAAYDCAVSAAQSLDPAQGHNQGLAAARESFSAFRLSYANASFSLSGSWERGGSVACCCELQRSNQRLSDGAGGEHARGDQRHRSAAGASVQERMEVGR
jgi:hypothetical protein